MSMVQATTRLEPKTAKPAPGTSVAQTSAPATENHSETSQGPASSQNPGIFDLTQDPALDELVRLAAVLSGADYAYLGWMDATRLNFKSTHGFLAKGQARTTSACHWTVLQAVPLLVKDAEAEKETDNRFKNGAIELENAISCRSYLGIPLMGPGNQVIGTLAVLAIEPSRFSKEHIGLLSILARQAVTRVELYNRTIAQEQAQRSRQRLERALAIERNFVAATLDSVPALVMVLDTAGRMIRFNRPAEDLTGLRLADIVGRPFVEEVLVEREARGWAQDKIRLAASGKIAGPYENLWRTAKGQPRRVSWTLRPLVVPSGMELAVSSPGAGAAMNPVGEVQYLIASGRDVTGQRQAEQALLTSEARYKHVVENSLGFVFTCTLEGSLTSLNPYTAESLGYRVEELTGKPLTGLLSKNGLQPFAESLKTIIKTGEFQGTIPFQRKDGIERKIAFRSRRMDLPGSPSFVLTHGMDVTEQEDTEEQLQLIRRQRELILAAVGDGIYGMDLDGKLSFLNPAAAKMLGYSMDELRGADVHEKIHHSHADGTAHSKANCPILLAMRSREGVRIRDDVFWRKDGTTVPVEYVASPLIDEGQIAGMVVAFQDISERRRLERMKDEFISTVSHELRTPLTSLRASLGLISSGSLDKRPEKQKQMLEVAIGNCDRLVRLVNDILDFDKVERGSMPLHVETFKVGDILRRAADVEHEAALKANITFRFDVSSSLLVAVDQDRILQVLAELVSNAIKFSPPQTIIKLAAEAAGNNEVCIIVEDQGRGIAQEKLDMIFERFQQGDASDSRALGGTGLGLAICRRIVQQHGGRIWAESEPNKGSKFLFTVPKGTPEASQGSKPL